MNTIYLVNVAGEGNDDVAFSSREKAEEYIVVMGGNDYYSIREVTLDVY
jgi:hypothetical protein